MADSATRNADIVAAGGTALGLAAPAALVATGVLAPIALLAAVPIAWAAFAVRSLLRRRHAAAQLTAPAAKRDDLLERVARIETDIAGNVPEMVQARVGKIAGIVRDTVPRLDQLGPGSSQAHAVVATATSYLPEAVGAYMRLPRRYADKRPVSGGKTSLMVLCDQLDLLAAKMDEVFVAVCQADADALVAHGRFLQEKFGSGSLAIDPASRQP